MGRGARNETNNSELDDGENNNQQAIIEHNKSSNG
jgi:hypothetical protein